MIRFAVIGTNFVTDSLLEAGSQIEDFKLQGVYSRSMEKAKDYAKEHGAPLTFDSLDDLAACDEIDAVYVASPNYLHMSQSIQMMNAGKHVLCEKTIASNSKELEEMIRVAKENRVVLVEAMRPVFDPGFQAIKDNLSKLGTIRRATFQYCQYSRRYDNYKNGVVENAFKPELSNGAIMDIGVYCVHPFVTLFGMPETIYSHSIKLDNGAEASGSVILGYEQMHGELLYAKITQARTPSQIQGEAGSMVIREIPDTVEATIYYNDGTVEELPIEKKENNMYYEIKEFIRLIEDGESGDEYLKNSVMELKVMDEVRRQQGIVFPADEV
ncbi:MAG: Gfo/Idh/MocA family oxidoreductase [Anaerostipes sp.]|nr:Gfo/Idh/MocA family oxidoreductase [Anaerostipes sp.]MDD3746864.1 Gfo/Idh/MocA family oxidoreductase [Anaerostipes sp.]